VLAAIVETGAPASRVCSVFKAVPQRLLNVRVADAGVIKHVLVQQAIAESERRLGERGRLLVRKSGTEPLIRIMAESEDEGLIAAVIDAVAAAVRSAGGSGQKAAE
jgi:phosphoglucosamine mutase